MSRPILLLILFVLLCLRSDVAKTQTIDGERLVQASLLVEQSDYTRPFYVGIHFDLAPGWYLYWINPGDSGLPVEATWKLPEGYSAGELLHPVPEKYVSKESISFGFKRELLLLCEIQPPATSTSNQKPEIGVSLDWLVCKESCLRGTAELSVDLRDIPPSRLLTAAHIERAKGLLPRDLAVLDLEAADPRVERDGQTATFSLQLSGRDLNRIDDFYPEIVEGFTIEHAGISIDGGRLTVPLTAHSSESELKNIRGLLIMGNKGYVLNVSITK